MAMTAGNVSGGNEGQTDSGRGVVFVQSVTMADRKTGKKAGTMASVSNIRQTVRMAGK